MTGLNDKRDFLSFDRQIGVKVSRFGVCEQLQMTKEHAGFFQKSFFSFQGSEEDLHLQVTV